MERLFYRRSNSSYDLQELIARVSKVDSTILIQGESGFGKEIVARERIIKVTARKTVYQDQLCSHPRKFIGIRTFRLRKRCLYRARKEGKMGIFELADQGTLFLDEVGDIPLHLRSNCWCLAGKRSLPGGR
jgi:transcriptional regulator with GAF, ATPase, and Fis domain